MIYDRKFSNIKEKSQKKSSFVISFTAPMSNFGSDIQYQNRTVFCMKAELALFKSIQWKTQKVMLAEL